MASGDFTLLNAKIAVKELQKRRKALRAEIQEKMGSFMDFVRADAADKEIISNSTGHRNPWKARKLQPSVPGRLTSRTGKMKHLLKQDLGTPWNGRGRLTYKKDTSAFKMLVRVVRVKEADKDFLATIRVYISDIPSAVAETGDKGWRMPVETKLTLKMRFIWETRQGNKRPYMAPSAKRNLQKLYMWVQDAYDRKMGGVV